MTHDLMKKIEAGRPEFSKGQRRIADYILTHYDKAAYMTAHKLGDVTGVSESTVVRFATELGYSGYPHMQHELRDMVKGRLTGLQRLELTWERMEGRSVIKTSMENDINKIRETMDTVQTESFDRAIEMIQNAKHIYIMGLRTSSFLAGFLGFYLHLMFKNVTVLGENGAEGDVFEQIFRVEEGDVLIGITFPRYSKRTLKGIRFARDRGAGIISITDGPGSPIASFSECPLYAPCEMASFVDSLVGPLSIINALIVALGLHRRDQIAKTLNDLEIIWDEYETYETEKTSGEAQPNED